MNEGIPDILEMSCSHRDWQLFHCTVPECLIQQNNPFENHQSLHYVTLAYTHRNLKKEKQRNLLSQHPCDGGKYPDLGGL